MRHTETRRKGGGRDMTSSDKDEKEVLARFDYPLRPVERGYANRTLYVNLTDCTIADRQVTDEMKRLFVGGRGFDLWLLWNENSSP